MTNAEELPLETPHGGEKQKVLNTTETGDITTKEEILTVLSNNPKIYFKSQQIDDPELTTPEKRAIAENVLNESHQKFLTKFGKYLLEKHLEYFECLSRPESSSDDENDIKFLLNDLKKNFRNKDKNVKNRRYTAMQSLVKEESYFTEKEMMKREPHLYEQLIGQYLSDSEKKARDSFDTMNEPFSNVLLEGIDKERTEELRKRQEQADLSDNSSELSFSSSKVDQPSEELYPKTPAEYKKHWGDFEDEQSTAGCSSKPQKPQRYITASEREMLRQEFVGIMYTKFLDGEDKEFDYSKVDDNSDLDDLDQIAQDDEDKYFDDDDYDGNSEEPKVTGGDSESEDELDIYMKHLDRHPITNNAI